MQLTAATRYAVHALAFLASQEGGHLAASHDIARAKGIPELFLLKVLKPLVTAGILLSLKGPNGGYRLAKPVKDVTLLEVVEAVEGPVRGQAELPWGGGGELERRLEAAFDQVAEVITGQFRKVKLSDLAGKRRKG